VLEPDTNRTKTLPGIEAKAENPATLDVKL